MKKLITLSLSLPAPSEPDIRVRQLHWTLDGAAQAPIEKPPGESFEVSGYEGQTIEAWAVDIGENGIASEPGAKFSSTLVDKVKPSAPAAPEVVGTSKKFEN